MPRPQKKRRVCCAPKNEALIPGRIMNSEIVFLTVDEYETLRLMDIEKMTQAECAVLMDVARTTVQRVYDSARYKLTDCLVNGKCLKVLGGDYEICKHYSQRCKNGCMKHCHMCKNKNVKSEE